MSPLGSIQSLWRYPVKSMLGEPCEHLDVNARGAEGDRLFAIRDASGKLGSGKNTRRFKRIDGLFGFRASYDGEVPIILFPDGRSMRGDHPDIHVALSKALGQSVTLEREVAISHFDDGPLHLVTSGSLSWLKAALPDAQIDERRFRPNLLLDTLSEAKVEQCWPGKVIAVADEVRLRKGDLVRLVD